MNEIRRKKIQKIIEKFEILKKEIDKVLTEEENYINNTPKYLRYTKKYQEEESNLSYLTDSYVFIDQLLDFLKMSIGE